MSKMRNISDDFSGLSQQQLQPPQEQECSSPFNQKISFRSQQPQSLSTIILKNMRFHPQKLTLPLSSPLTIKVSHNNSYQLSQISTRRKFIFSIQQLQIESDPIEQGQQYVFDSVEFSKKGEYTLKCISIPKMVCRVVVVEGRKVKGFLVQDGDMLRQEGDANLTQGTGCESDGNKRNATSQGKLSSVQQQQTEQQPHRQPIISYPSIPSKLPIFSPSNFEQYQKLLSEQLDNDCNSPTLSNTSETLQNRYLSYFKEEFRLWRVFFEQQEVKGKGQMGEQENRLVVLNEEEINNNERQQSKCDVMQIQCHNKQSLTVQMQLSAQQQGTSLTTPSLITLETPSQNIKFIQNKQHVTLSQSQNQHRSNTQPIIPSSLKVNLKKNKKSSKTNSGNMNNVKDNHNNNNTNNNANNTTNKNKSNRKKPLLKPTPHQHSTPTTGTPQKNLSLSQVKQLDQSITNTKLQYDYDLSSNSSSLSHESTTPHSKQVSSTHVYSHLHSHQEIVDRSHHGYSYFEQGEMDSSYCRANRKQTKKTISQYGFNVLRLEEEKQNGDRISVFGKQQQGVNMGSVRERLSDVEKKGAISSNNNSIVLNNSITTPHINKNTPNPSSRKCMSRTQTNSPVLRQSKKQNNFLTWAVQWAKQKEYKTVNVQRMNDHHLIKQLNTYMKNKFKVTEFMYC